jgi:hypothetical protein
MRFEEKHKLKKVAASKKSKEALMEGE